MSPAAERPNTPGIAGYVLASIIAFGVAGSLTYVLSAVVEAASDEGGTVGIAVIASVIYLPLLALVFGIYGLPIAVAGVVLVHVAFSRVANQAAHVAAAGVVAVALAAPYVRLTGLADVGPDAVVVVAATGVSAAIGRAAVIPLVRSRRRLAAEGRLTGTARW